MKIIVELLLDKVSAEAKQSPRLRMNYNFHKSLDDKCHRLSNTRPRTRLGIAHTSMSLLSLLPRFIVTPQRLSRSCFFVVELK